MSASSKPEETDETTAVSSILPETVPETSEVSEVSEAPEAKEADVPEAPGSEQAVRRLKDNMAGITRYIGRLRFFSDIFLMLFLLTSHMRLHTHYVKSR